VTALPVSVTLPPVAVLQVTSPPAIAQLNGNVRPVAGLYAETSAGIWPFFCQWPLTALSTFCANPQLVFGPVLMPDPQVWILSGVGPMLRCGAMPLAVDSAGGALATPVGAVVEGGTVTEEAEQDPGPPGHFSCAPSEERSSVHETELPCPSTTSGFRRVSS
jgi:hypothetical protein